MNKSRKWEIQDIRDISIFDRINRPALASGSASLPPGRRPLWAGGRGVGSCLYEPEAGGRARLVLNIF